MRHKIIVTGASRGIGRALSLYLTLERNCDVLAISRDEEMLESLCESGKGHIHSIAADLTNRGSYIRIQEWISTHWLGELDVLINNAGALVSKPFREMDEQDFDLCVDVNYKSVYFFSQAMLSNLEKGKLKHILNIGSIGGVQGSSKFAGLSVYSSSKGALAILSECMAEELSIDEISVNCLALGSVQTEMLTMAFPGYKAQLESWEMGKMIGDISLDWAGKVSGKVVSIGKVGV